MRDEDLYFRNARLRALKAPRKGWQGIIEYTDEDGHRRTKTKMLGDVGKREAARRLDAWRAKMEEEAIARGSAMPSDRAIAGKDVVAYVRSIVERKGRSKEVEASTVSGYEASARALNRYLHGIKVAELTTEHVQAMINDMVGDGYSSSTITKPYRLLKMCMDEAEEVGAIDRSPCNKRVKLPKRRPVKPGINALDANGRKALLDALSTAGLSSVVMAATISLYTGMRIGEVCALQWGDIDLTDPEAPSIWVRRSLGRGKGGYYVKEPKTGKVRDIPAPDDLLRQLDRWKAVQASTFQLAGALLLPSSFVIGTPAGWRSPVVISKEWKALVTFLGIKGTEGRLPTFHDLRHTYATMMVAAKVDVKTVSAILGHANAAMTLNVYAAADPEAKKAAGKIVGGVMVPRESQVQVFRGAV